MRTPIRQKIEIKSRLAPTRRNNKELPWRPNERTSFEEHDVIITALPIMLKYSYGAIARETQSIQNIHGAASTSKSVEPFICVSA